jgi:hypothetical protein
MQEPTPNAMPGAQNAPGAEQAPPAAAPSAPQPEPPSPPPPWGTEEDFDPDRAWSLIQNLRREAAEYKSKADPIIAEHEARRREAQSELDRYREDNTTLAQREQSWRSRAVLSEAKALAERFIDADAAVALIGDLSCYATEDAIDNAQLEARFDQLAADKPHLLKSSQIPPGFTPNRGQGQSGTGHPVPIDAQIKAAQDRGDLMSAISLKQQKFYAQK